MSASRTPSQTIGPFFGFALPWPSGPCVVAAGTAGAIELSGCLFDGRGDPVVDGLIETWQADPEGRLDGRTSGFRGFARSPTDRDGRFRIVTLKPGPVRAADGALHAPQVAVSVFARGLLKRAATRMYFPDEQAMNAADPVLGAITDPSARATLVAARVEGGYSFDIRLQGERETVFFDV